MPGYNPQFGYTAAWATQHSPPQVQAEGTDSNSPIAAHAIQYPQNNSPHSMHQIQGQYIITQPGVGYPAPTQFGPLIQPEFVKSEDASGEEQSPVEIQHQQVHYQPLQVQHGGEGMIYQPLNHYYITDPQHQAQQQSVGGVVAPGSGAAEGEVQHLGTPQNVDTYETHQLEHGQHSPSAGHHSPGHVQFNTDAYAKTEAASPGFQNNTTLSSSSEYASVSSEQMQSI